MSILHAFTLYPAFLLQQRSHVGWHRFGKEAEESKHFLEPVEAILSLQISSHFKLNRKMDQDRFESLTPLEKNVLAYHVLMVRLCLADVSLTVWLSLLAHFHAMFDLFYQLSLLCFWCPSFSELGCVGCHVPSLFLTPAAADVGGVPQPLPAGPHVLAARRPVHPQRPLCELRAGAAQQG